MLLITPPPSVENLAVVLMADDAGLFDSFVSGPLPAFECRKSLDDLADPEDDDVDEEDEDEDELDDEFDEDEDEDELDDDELDDEDEDDEDDDEDEEDEDEDGGVKPLKM